MAGDILLAGLTLTAEEWRALDPEIRAELVALVGKVELFDGRQDDGALGSQLLV